MLGPEYWAGKEIFFIGPGREMMAVAVRNTGVGLEIGTPKVLFDSRMATNPNLGSFDRRQGWTVSNSGATTGGPGSAESYNQLASGSQEVTSSGTHALVTTKATWL